MAGKIAKGIQRKGSSFHQLAPLFLLLLLPCLSHAGTASYTQDGSPGTVIGISPSDATNISHINADDQYSFLTNSSGSANANLGATFVTSETTDQGGNILEGRNCSTTSNQGGFASTQAFGTALWGAAGVRNGDCNLAGSNNKGVAMSMNFTSITAVNSTTVSQGNLTVRINQTSASVVTFVQIVNYTQGGYTNGKTDNWYTLSPAGIIATTMTTYVYSFDKTNATDILSSDGIASIRAVSNKSTITTGAYSFGWDWAVLNLTGMNHTIWVNHSSQAFSIAAGESITDINVTNNIWTNVSEGVNVYMDIYNFITSAWENCQSGTVTSTNTTFACSITTNPSNYNDSARKITVRMYSPLTGVAHAINENFLQYNVTTAVPPSECANLSSSFTLTSNVTSTGGVCFNVTAANVMLNCSGFSITGSNLTNSYGVYSEQDGTRVVDCDIYNFQHGVYFEGVNFGELLDNFANSTHSVGSGFFLNNSSYGNITDNFGFGTSAPGFYMQNNSSYNNLTNNTGWSNSSVGVYVLTSLFNNFTDWTGVSDTNTGFAFNEVNYSIVNNTFGSSRTWVGFQLQNSLYNTVLNSNGTTSTSANGGIRILTSSFNNLTNAVGTGLSGTGIVLTTSGDDNLLANSTGQANSGIGINVASGSRNTLNGTIGASNTSRGISISGGNNNTVDCRGASMVGKNNSGGAGTDYAIYTGTANNTIMNCVISNYSYGLYVDGADNSSFISNNISTTSTFGSPIILRFTADGQLLANNTLNSMWTPALSLNNSAPSSSFNNITNNTLISSTYYALFMNSSQNNTIEGNVLDSTASIPLYMENSSHSRIYNNTFVSAGSTLVHLTAASGNNTFYWNNFTATSGLYVNDTNSSADASLQQFANHYNSTIGGVAAGNIWGQVLDGVNNGSIAITGSNPSPWPALFYGDAGANYPFNNTQYTDAKLLGNVTDWGPLVPPPAALACGALSSAGTTYTMTENLVRIGGEGTCFTVTAAGVTLNCVGFSITGANESDAYGVFTDQARTVVKNCVINSFERGIYYQRAINGTLYNNTLYSNTKYGIALNSTNSTNVLNNTVATNAWIGAFLEAGRNNTINTTNARNELGVAIELDGTVNSSVSDSQAYNSLSTGILLNNTINITVDNATAYGNAQYGLRLISSDYNLLSNSTFYNNTLHGLYAVTSSSDYNVFQNLTSRDNGDYGIYISQGNYNNFSYTYASNNTGGGIYLVRSTGNFLNQTALQLNWKTGIETSHTSSTGNNFTGVFVNTTGSSHGVYINGGTGTYLDCNSGWLNGAGNGTACLQDQSNQSTQCGGIPNGKYACEGDWDATQECSLAADGDWNTFGQFNTLALPSFSTIYMNYTVPVAATSGSNWQVQAGDIGGGGGSFTNYSFSGATSGCWGTNPLRLRIQSSGDNATAFGDCWDYGASAWVPVFSEGTGNQVYEEAMYWDVRPIGIYSALENTTVLGCNVSAFQTGISYYQANGTVSHNSVHDNWLYGFLFNQSNNNTLSNDTAYLNNGSGLYFLSSSSNSISSSASYSNTVNGFLLDSTSENNSLYNLTAYKNAEYGIYLSSSGYNNITNSTASNNTDGIRVFSSNAVQVYGSRSDNNSQYGFRLQSNQYNNYTLNTAYNNSQDGFYLYRTLSVSDDFNTVSNSTAYNNSGSGFRIGTNSNVPNLTNNTAYNNRLSGFNISGIDKLIFRNSTSYGNLGEGMRLTSVTSGNFTGNNISSNYSAGLNLSGAITSIFENNTLNGTTYTLYITDTSTTSNFTNNTLLSSSGTLLYLASGSSGNRFWWNNFSSTSGPYVNDTNDPTTPNYYNISNVTVGIGNIWHNVINGSVPIAPSQYPTPLSGFYYGTSGSGYPYNNTTSQGKVYGNVADYGPFVPPSSCRNLTAGFTLTSSVASTGGVCFNVTVPNVMLSCSGYTITGSNTSSSFGVLSNQVNTTVRDCVIQNFSTGILFNGSQNSFIINDTVNTTFLFSSGISGNGILLTNHSNYTVIANTTAFSYYGGALNGYGFYINASNFVNVTGSFWNTSGLQKSNGIYFIKTNYSSINLSAGVGGIGLYLDGSSYNSVSNSNATRTDSGGAAAAPYNGANYNNWTSIIANNTAGEAGFRFTTNANFNNVSGLVGQSTSGYGIDFLVTSNDNSLSNCQAIATTGYGIRVSSGSRNNITNCSATTATTSFYAIYLNQPTTLKNFTAINTLGYALQFGNPGDDSNVSDGFIDAGRTGILLDDVLRSSFRNFSVITRTRTYACIEMIDSSNNNSFSNFTLNCNGSGIMMYRSSTASRIPSLNTFANGTITNSSASFSGIYLYDGYGDLTPAVQNNTFSNLFISNFSTNFSVSMYSALNNTFANNTLAGPIYINDGGAPAFPQPAENNTFYNNTIMAPDNNSLTINASGGNLFYWNNFTATSGYFVNDTNGSNFYNTSNGTVGIGNIWHNVINGSVPIIPSQYPTPLSGFYYGTSGSGYPYNNTTSQGKVYGNVADYGPFVPPSSCRNLTANFTMVSNVTSTGGTCFPVTANNITLNCAGFSIIGANASDNIAFFSNYNYSLIRDCHITNFAEALRYNNGVGSTAFNNTLIVTFSGGNVTHVMNGSNSTNLTYNGILAGLANGTFIETNSQGTLVDCMQGGYSVNVNTGINGSNYPSTNGVYSSAPNTTVQNCNISNFQYGIQYSSASDSRIYGVSTANTGAASAVAIYLNVGSGYQVNNVTLNATYGAAHTQGYGISGSTISYSNISNSNITANYIPLSLSGSYNNLTNLYLREFGYSSPTQAWYAVLMDSATFNNFVNLTALGGGLGSGGRAAFNVQRSSNNNITNSTISGGAGVALDMSLHATASSSNRYIGNVISTTTATAITASVASGINNVFTNNTISSSSGLAILLTNSNNTFANNTISGATSAIVANVSTSNNVFYNNTFISTGGAGNLLYIQPTAGNNTFYWNNFTATSGYYVNDTNHTNYYNTSNVTVGIGNVWTDVINGSVDIVATNSYPAPFPSGQASAFYYGEAGDGYPYNNTTATGGRIYGNVTDYGPITGTLPVTTMCKNISTAGYQHNFTANATSTGTCINVTAANVQINCSGYSMIGANLSGTYGVYSNQQNTSVIDCTIQNFSSAIYYNGATDGLMKNNTITTTLFGGTGITLNNSAHRNNLTQNAITNGNSTGIYVSGGSNTTVDCLGTNIFGQNFGFTSGVYSSGAFNLTVKNCNISKFATGVYFLLTTNSTIRNASAGSTLTYGTDGITSGIHLVSSSNDNLVDNVTASSASGYGAIFIYDNADRNTVANSILTATGGYGLGSETSDNLIYANLTITGQIYFSGNQVINITNVSATAGIIAFGSDNITVANSSFIGGGVGIDLRAGSDNNRFTDITVSTLAAVSGVTLFPGGENNTIDCQGKPITGINSSDSYGIYTVQFNTTVTNCTIKSYDYGIYFANSSTNGTASYNNVTSNRNIGLRFVNSSNNTLTSNYLCSNPMDLDNAGLNNTGTLNSCDSFLNYSENSHSGCTFACTSLWHRFFGNVTGSIILGTSGVSPYIYSWNNATGLNVYMADYDTTVDWKNLQAIGKTAAGAASTDDFKELDSAFASSAYNDNITNTYSDSGSGAKYNDTYVVYSSSVTNVPVFNSSLYNTAFKTGILWDNSSGGEYTGLSQPTVWVAKVNTTQIDVYGNYQYLISIPYTLKNYTAGNDLVAIYAELQ